MNYNEFLGIEVVEDHEDGLTVEMPFRPEHRNIYGALHGGATASIADTAVGLAIYRRWPGSRSSTIELKINYLRPAKGSVIRARSKFVKTGRTIIVATVEVTDEQGTQIATALMSYFMLSFGEESS